MFFACTIVQMLRFWNFFFLRHGANDLLDVRRRDLAFLGSLDGLGPCLTLLRGI